MEKKLFVLVMALTAMVSFVTACGDDTNEGETDSDTTTDTVGDTDTETEETDTNTDTSVVAIQAATADGPCIIGSTYFITELEPVTFTALNTISQATDGLGRINASLKPNTPYEVTVQCFDFNEITNKTSTVPVTLRAFLFTGEGGAVQNASINDTTHIVANYLAQEFKASPTQDYATFRSLNEGAFGKLVGYLPFIKMPVDFICDPAEMDIVSGSDPNGCNDAALAIELVIRHFVVATAPTEADQVSLLTLTLNTLQAKFIDGVLEEADLAGIIEKFASLDVISAQANLSNHLAGLGGTPPNVNLVIDLDDDSKVNALDDDIDGDGVLNTEDSLPYNPSIGNSVFWGRSGLIWQWVASTESYNLADAITYCDNLELAGETDWRLPSISELRSEIVGCSATATGGACGVTDECTEYSEACFGSDCSGCSILPTGESYWGMPVSDGVVDLLSSSSGNDLTGSEFVWFLDVSTGSVEPTDVVAVAPWIYVRCVRSSEPDTDTDTATDTPTDSETVSDTSI